MGEQAVYEKLKEHTLFPTVRPYEGKEIEAVVKQGAIHFRAEQVPALPRFHGFMYVPSQVLATHEKAAHTPLLFIDENARSHKKAVGGLIYLLSRSPSINEHDVVNNTQKIKEHVEDCVYFPYFSLLLEDKPFTISTRLSIDAQNGFMLIENILPSPLPDAVIVGYEMWLSSEVARLLPASGKAIQIKNIIADSYSD